MGLIQFELKGRKRKKTKPVSGALVSKGASCEKLGKLFKKVNWTQTLRELRMEEEWDFFKSKVQKHGICNSMEQAGKGREESQVTPQITTTGRM